MLNTDNNDDFSFVDDITTDVDFFSVDENEEIKDEEEESKQNPKPEDKSKDKEEQKEDDLFKSAETDTPDEEEEEEESSENKNKEKEETPVGDSIITLSMLKDKGHIEYELEEGEELTDERAGEIIEDSMDTLFEDRIEELFKDVPEVVKNMNKFVLQGGDINEFLDKVAVQNSSGLTEGMDLEDEANQEIVIRNGLEGEGYDEEYITAQLDFLRDSKRLKKHSEAHYEKWNEKRKADQKAILTSRDNKAKADKISRRELKGKVSTFLKDTEEVTGFTVTKQDRKVLPDYMSDRNVKLQNGNQITGMQKDLMRVLNSPIGSVQMAKLLKAASQEGELNFEEIKTETETKVAKKVRENVRRNKKSVISQSGGQSKKTKRPLADYFN